MSSQHVARISWERGDRGFTYPEYSRAHRVDYEGGISHPMSAAPEFLGHASLPNPEELLVAALSSCHMLTFLAICARKSIVVDRYEDEATGTLERRAGERMRVTHVVLRPRIVFAGAPPDASSLESLHHQAHQGCFIASSVSTEVTIEPPR